MPSSDSDPIARFVNSHPLQVATALAEALRSGRVEGAASALVLQSVLGLSSVAAVSAADLLRSSQSETLAAGLGAAIAMRTIRESAEAKVDLVWTGPDVPGLAVRPTGAVVEELLRSAIHEVVLLGYAVSQQGERVSHVLRLLGDAVARECAVTVVLHSDDASANRAQLLAGWALPVHPRVLTWRPPPGYPYTKMHAKALVVDRRRALVTSANLTLHGLEANLELGVRIDGAVAAAITERIDMLIARGVLVDLNA